MLSAGMLFSVMMIAVRSGILQFASQIRFHGRVGISGRARAQFDPSFLERRLRAAADPSADQHVDRVIREEPGQGAVAAAV